MEHHNATLGGIVTATAIVAYGLYRGRSGRRSESA
jgi:hypothetical protein